MGIDRTFRSLSALSTASTSRVLNLLAIGRPMAKTRNRRQSDVLLAQLNSAIILKHRLRADEMDLLPGAALHRPPR